MFFKRIKKQFSLVSYKAQDAQSCTHCLPCVIIIV